MSISFYNGVAGAMSFQNEIDIVGDNIANINTPGFKETIAEFGTVFAATLSQTPSTFSDVSFGSYINSTSKNLSIGPIVDSDNIFDMAIADEGWFQIKNGNNIFYTRNGSFKRDAQGYLVNDNGDYLLVANANNIISENGKFFINRNIDTDNLLPASSLSPISLPYSIILPSLPTKNVSLQTNLLNDFYITTTKPANENIDFSAMYNKDGYDMQIRNGNNLFFGFGHQVEYENGLLKSTYCFEDDIKDNTPVKIDFVLNSTHIKLELQDGSTKKEIANAIAKELNKNGISASVKNSKLIISTTDKFILTSNTPLMQNASAAVLTYQQTSDKEFEFSDLKEFIDNLQTLSQNIAPELNISLEKGEIIIQNPTNSTINSYLFETNNSNKMFLENLSSLGEEILPNSQNKSFQFLSNSQEFRGDIINENGDKTTVTFIFTKQKVSSDNQIWQGEITIPYTDKELKISEDFVFDTNGMLISPKELNFNNINFTFSLSAFTKANNTTNFSFSQDGIEEGALKDYQIQEDGKIVGIFSNTQEITLAQIPVFHFKNDQGLASIGNSRFIKTENSGEAFLYKDQNGNYIPSKILSYKLETSNVNFTNAMTELILTQKAFQASAKTITTSDEMIQKAINLKR